jgi:hypothetical protein
MPRALVTSLACRHFGRPVIPLIPAWRMSISTMPWPTLTPRPSTSSAWTRRAP